MSQNTKNKTLQIRNSTAEFLTFAYQPLANPIISQIRKSDTKLPIRNAKEEILVKKKKGAIASPEFLEIWNRISQKTHYRVKVERDRFIEIAVKKMEGVPRIERAKIAETTATIDVKKEGVSAEETNARTIQLENNLTSVPDVFGILRNELHLTKATLLEIFKRADRGQDILNNPEKFVEEAHLILKNVKAEMLVDGIRYIKIQGEEYSAQEVFEKDELLAYIDNAIASDKSVYDYAVVDDSNVERDFAKDLEKDPDVRFFFELPDNFKIDTPFGKHNPDWAVLLNEYGTDKLYLVVETKSTLDERKRHVFENENIECARRHFAELGTVDYQDATSWKFAKPSV